MTEGRNNTGSQVDILMKAIKEENRGHESAEWRSFA